MAGKKDTMLYSLGRARLTGSAKTIHNHKVEASGFVRVLRRLGFGVKEWSNISNKHIAAAVQEWRQQELGVATIKSYLAGVRAVCTAYGNERIHADNTAFGLENRVYVTNRDKAVLDEAYVRVLATLKEHGEIGQRVGLMLRLQRQFGLRLEESLKMNPHRDVQGELLQIHVGTKGGRPRWVPIRNAQQREALEMARQSGFYRSLGHGLIPRDMREEEWRDKVYRIVRSCGLTKEQDGTMHGLRHAYAHQRYLELSGFLPPVKFKVADDYFTQAEAQGGKDWRSRDEFARCTIREEMGHGIGREDIDSQYLGRWR